MKVTFLGTGTSQGVPVIGCKCEVCTSDDPRDKRLRTSAFIEANGHNVVIDVGPDFRQQMLRENIDQLTSVLITHEHNDHIIGLDDIRPFYFKQKKEISYHVTEKVLKEIKLRFPYVFNSKPYPGAPRVEFTLISPYQSFGIGETKVLPIPVKHGKIEVIAFRIDDFAYVTDASFIPEKSQEHLYNLDILVINTLRKEKHNSHFNLEEALEIIKRLQPKQAYLTHISHQMG